MKQGATGVEIANVQKAIEFREDRIKHLEDEIQIKKDQVYILRMELERLQSTERKKAQEIHDAAIWKKAYEQALNDFGILHGEDAKRFNEELKNPSEMTPEARELIRQAWKIYVNEELNGRRT